jgi:hypothetical protein
MRCGAPIDTALHAKLATLIAQDEWAREAMDRHDEIHGLLAALDRYDGTPLDYDSDDGLIGLIAKLGGAATPMPRAVPGGGTASSVSMRTSRREDEDDAPHGRPVRGERLGETLEGEGPAHPSLRGEVRREVPGSEQVSIRPYRLTP